MGYEPLMDGRTSTNVYTEHAFAVRVLFGTTAITSYKSKDATIVRNSPGNYSVTLPKPYTAITSFGAGFTFAAGAILFAVIVDESAVATTGVVIVEIRTETGTATDPATGSKMYLELGASCDQSNDLYGG